MSLGNRGRTALGKGLGALIPPPRFSHLNDDYFMCPVDKVTPDPHQPRQRFDDDALAELVASVKEKGILQPIVVRKGEEEGTYIVVAGERRLRASRRAGLKDVPVLVKDVASDEALELALIENIQREDLNPIEEAAAFQRLLESKQYTQEVLARHLGKQRSTIANALRLLKLESAHQQLLIDGSITAGHARALLSLDDEEARADLARRVVDQGLSVRDAETVAKRAKEATASRGHKPSTRSDAKSALDTYYDHLADTLSKALGTHVAIKGKGRRGKLVVSFSDLEQLSDLAARLQPEARDLAAPHNGAGTPAMN